MAPSGHRPAIRHRSGTAVARAQRCTARLGASRLQPQAPEPPRCVGWDRGHLGTPPGAPRRARCPPRGHWPGQARCMKSTLTEALVADDYTHPQSSKFSDTPLAALQGAHSRSSTPVLPEPSPQRSLAGLDRGSSSYHVRKGERSGAGPPGQAAAGAPSTSGGAGQRTSQPCFAADHGTQTCSWARETVAAGSPLLSAAP